MAVDQYRPSSIRFNPFTGRYVLETGEHSIPLEEAIHLGGAGRGTTRYVDALNGDDSGNGLTPLAPLLTMARAFALLQSGDTIVFSGKIREQLVAPVQVFDVTIIGAGNRPRHADAAPAPVGGSSAATWTTPASPTAATPLLEVMQQGWRLANCVMAGPTDAACVLLLRNGGAGNLERDASHFESVGVRYASGRDGIEQSGGCYHVGIFGNEFHDLTGYALKSTAGAGIAAPYRWQIEENDFDTCANWMGAWSAHSFRIKRNSVREITTNRLDTSGGSGHNVITDNEFDVATANFTNAASKVKGHATDVWSNTVLDGILTGVPS